MALLAKCTRIAHENNSWKAQWRDYSFKSGKSTLSKTESEATAPVLSCIDELSREIMDDWLDEVAMFDGACQDRSILSQLAMETHVSTTVS